MQHACPSLGRVPRQETLAFSSWQTNKAATHDLGGEEPLAAGRRQDVQRPLTLSEARWIKMSSGTNCIYASYVAQAYGYDGRLGWRKVGWFLSPLLQHSHLAARADWLRPGGPEAWLLRGEYAPGRAPGLAAVLVGCVGLHGFPELLLARR